MRKTTQRLTALLLALLLLTAPALAEMTGERPDGAFLEDAGGELLETMRGLMADETFVAALGASEEITSQIAAWAEAMDGQPLYTRVYSYPEFEAALSYMNEGEALPLSDAARSYFAPQALQTLCAHVSAQRGAAYLAAANPLRGEKWYALPEGFADCVLVYDFGDVAFTVGLRVETVAGQEAVHAEGCVCAPEIREALALITAPSEETQAAEGQLSPPENASLENSAHP